MGRLQGQQWQQNCLAIRQEGMEGVIDENMGQYLVQWRPTWVDKKDVHADKKVRQFLARQGRLYRRWIQATRLYKYVVTTRCLEAPCITSLATIMMLGDRWPYWQAATTLPVFAIFRWSLSSKFSCGLIPVDGILIHPWSSSDAY